MRRLILSLTILALTIPAVAQRGVRGNVGAAPHRGMMNTVGRGPGIVSGGSFRARGINRHSNGFRNFSRHRFGCGFSNTFAFNSIPNSFCGGFGFNSGFNNFGGYGSGLYYGSYDSMYDNSTGAAYAEHALRYDDSRDREMNELLLDLRDQQRELDYLVNNMRHEQRQDYGPQAQQQSQQGPQARGSMLRQQMRGSTTANTASNQPATALVFKDGRRIDVRNYVMTKNTITVLDGGVRQHFPLTQIDVPATQKANDERGVTFKAPTVSVSLLCNPSDPNVSCRPHTDMNEAQRTLTP